MCRFSRCFIIFSVCGFADANLCRLRRGLATLCYILCRLFFLGLRCYESKIVVKIRQQFYFSVRGKKFDFFLAVPRHFPLVVNLPRPQLAKMQGSMYNTSGYMPQGNDSSPNSSKVNQSSRPNFLFSDQENSRIEAKELQPLFHALVVKLRMQSRHRTTCLELMGRRPNRLKKQQKKANQFLMNFP